MRTFTNPGPEDVVIPSLNVTIAPGESLDVDGFQGACPECLTEATKKSTPAKAARTEDK